MGICEEDRTRGNAVAAPRRMKSVADVHRARPQVRLIKPHLDGANKFTRVGPYAKGMHRPAGFPLIHAAPYVLIDRLPGAGAPTEPSDKFGIFPRKVGIDVVQAKRGQPDNTIG
jgi:hypothetical protein